MVTEFVEEISTPALSTDAIVMIPVSSPSYTLSSTAVTVNEVVVSPAEMVAVASVV